jgi:hypothetical protein
MSHQRDVRDVYRQHAEACLAVLTKTTNPTSQAMLTAMAHTWLRLADSVPGNAEQYWLNADEARRRGINAEPKIQTLWLRLADSWLHLLRGDESPSQSHVSNEAGWRPKSPDDSKSWH